METLNLNAEVRTEEKAKDLKKSKQLAWVVYGKNKETISIKLDYSEFLKTFRKSGESQIINLKIGKETIEVLVYQIQNHPISGDFIHIDFYAITRWETLTTKITLKFIGKSEAVKEGAIIDEQLKEIEVKCLPRNLVDYFEVDLSELKEMWDSIRVADLKVDTEKFEILTGSDEIIVTAAKPAKVEEISDEAPEAPEIEEEVEEKSE